MNYQNPYDTFGGVFLPHFMLSSRRASLGAKVLYSMLAAGADIRGESLLSPSLLAAKLGVEKQVVLEFVNELSEARLIKVRQDPAGPEFLCCHFPPHAWQKESPQPNENTRKHISPNTVPRLLKLPTPEAEGDASTSFSNPEAQASQAAESVEGKRAGASRYPKEVCIEYAKARREAEGKIDNPYALGTALWKSGEGDEEITLWLRAREADESAA